MSTSLSVALILLAALSSQAGAPAQIVSLDKTEGFLALLDPGEGRASRRQLAAVLAAPGVLRSCLAASIAASWDGSFGEQPVLQAPAISAALRSLQLQPAASGFLSSCSLVRGP